MVLTAYTWDEKHSTSGVSFVRCMLQLVTIQNQVFSSVNGDFMQRNGGLMMIYPHIYNISHPIEITIIDSPLQNSSMTDGICKRFHGTCWPRCETHGHHDLNMQKSIGIAS